MNNGVWRALRAQPVPQQIDDLIQDNMFAWHQAADKVTLDDLEKVVPLMSQVVHRTTAPGVSWFDTKEWIDKGRPALRAEEWAKICKTIAERDESRTLGPIHEMCVQMLTGRGSGRCQNKISRIR